MAATKPPAATKAPAAKVPAKPLEIILQNMRKAKGAIVIDAALQGQLKASLAQLKGKAMHSAVTDVVLFSQYLAEKKNSPAAAQALLQVAADVIPNMGGWASKKK